MHEWTEMVKELMTSGQNVKIYCRRKGISEPTYYYRQNKVRQAACDEMKKGNELQPTWARVADVTYVTEALFWAGWICSYIY
jgi:hypothetical protein